VTSSSSESRSRARKAVCLPKGASSAATKRARSARREASFCRPSLIWTFSGSIFSANAFTCRANAVLGLRWCSEIADFCSLAMSSNFCRSEASCSSAACRRGPGGHSPCEGAHHFRSDCLWASTAAGFANIVGLHEFESRATMPSLTAICPVTRDTFFEISTNRTRNRVVIIRRFFSEVIVIDEPIDQPEHVFHQDE
jgi:hypothetical protein